MAEFDFSVTEDTQATLLLCGTLGKSNAAAHPLTLPQYNAVVQALVSLGKRPSDLLHDGGLVETVCAMPTDNARLKEPASADRVKSLLDRGFALSMAMNRWAQYGVRPVGRGDELYPARMKQYLKSKAPAVLYYAGRDLLWLGGGMAVVGSRNISDEATVAIRRVVGECVEAGLAIVSGGARGADQISMQEAWACGGQVIGALPGDLLKSCIARENREALSAGRALLFSAVDPDERFTPVNAMDRNKYIYAMADCAFVAQSDTKGGTWTGAVEELKRPEHHPVYVYMGHARVEGCAQLVEKGGIAWRATDSLQSMLAKTNGPAMETTQVSQPTLFDYTDNAQDIDDGRKACEPIARYEAKENASMYSALVSVVVAALSGKRLTEKALKAAVDPDGYLAPKGWKTLIGKACENGQIASGERARKRGKPEKIFFLP